MKFAKWVFRISGIYGILVLIPYYFLETNPLVNAPPAITHPEYYYGFVGLGLSFQILFLIIAADPLKYRFAMIPSLLEKISFGGAVFALYFAQRVPAQLILAGTLDLFMAALFAAAYLCLKP